MVDLRHEALTKELRGLIFKVRNELATGWSEDVYHQALVKALEQNQIAVISKPRFTFFHRGVLIHTFEPDIIAWDTIILELKELPYHKEFASEHYAQLIHYLKFCQKDLGLLINFGPTKVNIQRVVWNEPELDILEQYDEILPHLAEADKINLRQIRQHVLSLARQYGLGYSETIYRKLLAVEANWHGLPCVTDVTITPTWNGFTLPHHTTQHLQISENYLVHIRALIAHPTGYDFNATRTFLRNLNLNFGLVVNFGRQQLQIYGVKAY